MDEIEEVSVDSAQDELGVISDVAADTSSDDVVEVSDNAIDDNANDDLNTTSKLGTSNDNDVLGYEGTIYVAINGDDDNEGSIDAPVATIGKAIELANDGSHQIIINEGTYTGNDYQVTDDLAITGVGKVTLDADNNGGLFSIGNVNKFELSNLILTNVIEAAISSNANELILDNVTIINSQPEGSLISSKAKLTVKNSNISNTRSGYVISQKGNGNILIYNTVFENNGVEDSDSFYGVITISGTKLSGNLVVEDSKFINNTATKAVIVGNRNYYINIKGTEFINNVNTDSGGGAVRTQGKTLNVTDSVFINNKAVECGGAIFVDLRTTANVDRSIFINNSVTAPEGEEEYRGDALYNENHLTVTNSVLLTNTDHCLIYNGGENDVYAQNNWWGTNDNPQNLVYTYFGSDGGIDVSDWVTMDASFAPADAHAGDEVTVAAIFSNANLPDGIEVRFTSTSGLGTVVSTVDGQASTTYKIDRRDAAITATSSNVTIEMPLSPFTTIVTNDTFYNFFDESGFLRDDALYNVLIFQGQFSNLVDVITFNRDINVTADDATLDNIAIKVDSDDVKLSGLNLNADKSFVDNNNALIYATGSDIEISDVVVNYTAPGEMEAVAIYANATNNFRLTNSEITYVSTNPGSKYNYGLEVRGSENVLIKNNTVDATLPSVDVSWSGSGIGTDLVLAVGIQGGKDINFTENTVNVNTNGGIGDYPTIDAVMIHSVDNLLVNLNNITHMDTTTSDTQRYYYALDIYSSNATVEENNVIVNTTSGIDRTGTAYPIQLTGPFTITVNNNNLTAISKGPTCGIYASNWNGYGDLTVTDNTIDITGSATAGGYALLAGIEAEIDMTRVYNNTINVANFAAYDDTNPVYGVSMTSAYMSGNPAADIKDNTITVDGKYAVYYAKAANTNVTENALYAHELTADGAAFIESGDNNIIEHNYPPFDAEIIIEADDVWIGNGNTIVVNIAGATGNVTIKVNEKEFKDLVLNEGRLSQVVEAADLVTGINEVNVIFTSDDDAFIKSGNANSTFLVYDGVVTQETYSYYFNQDDGGKLFDYVPEGATLDFQGSIINPDKSITVHMYVSKPVNIITTTNDAYVDLNTTAGSLLGENPGNRFAITRGGSGSNVTGIKFHNTQLWISNTTNVVLDNISVVVEGQRVGSGVGVTSIRDNSSYVTLKNSYLYTGNNGGSTTFTFSWANYCTIDNCTVKVGGEVGNLIYLNTYNIANRPSGPLNNYNKVTNNKLYGKIRDAISVGIMVEGEYNIIENNTLYNCSMGGSMGSSDLNNNNSYIGNTLTEGGYIEALPSSLIYNNNVTGHLTCEANSIVYNNNVTGYLTCGANSIAYNNTVGSLSISGANSIAYNNTVGSLSISGANSIAENNTVNGTVTISNKATNTTLIGNDIVGTVTVNSNKNVIKKNNITTTDAYAVNLKTKTGNNVTDNLLIASAFDGDDAVKYSNANNIVKNNRPFSTNIIVTVDNITVGETALINITVDDEATGTVTAIVNAKTYTAEISEGKAQIPVEDLPASDYTVAVSFDSTNINYRDAENSTVFNVAKLETAIAIDIINATIGENATVAVTVPNATGSVKIIVNGEENTVDLVDGQANYVIEDIAAGNYNIVVIYAGDKNNDAASNSTSFTVDKLVPTINVTVPTVEYSYDAVITVELPSDATGNVFVDVGSGKYYAEVENGIATVTVPNAAANATVTVRYAGDDKYEAATADDELVVTKLTTTLSADDFTMAYKDGSALTVKLVDSKGTPVIGARVLVNNTKGIYKYDTDAKGIATIPVYLKPGEYSYVITYAGDSTHEAANLTTTVVVEKGDVIMTVSNMTVTYKDGTNYTVTLTDVEGNVISGVTVSVTTEGIATYRYHTDANGVTTAPIKWKPGEYTFTAAFAGNNMYKAGNVSSTVIVEKAALSIDANDISMGYNDGTNFTIKLTDANGDAVSGVTVSISDGNKVYKYHTDENGIVNTPVTWKPGEYNYTVSFAGNSLYDAANITKSISISKLDTVLTAADIDMGFKDGTNFTAKLVDANGNAISGVVVKVNNTVSVYKYKTDSEGMISAPINLKPGEYEYVAFFEGNSVYNACNVTSTVKITK